MLTRLPAAIIRALLVVALVVMPSALIHTNGPQGSPIIVLIAFFAALFTAVEYSAASPSLVEFRDAPPFNRMRFAALFAIVLSLSMIMRGYDQPTELTAVFHNTGATIGRAIDFPFSPVRLMVVAMPAGDSAVQVEQMREVAGLSYLIALISVVSFILLLRLRRWPPKGGAFNVWVNLPTFDPTAGGDVVARLQRDAQFNVILGFLLPFLVPAVFKMLAAFGFPLDFGNPGIMIWTVTAWAFLPASLLMRGVALSRVADMINVQRDLARVSGADGGYR